MDRLSSWCDFAKTHKGTYAELTPYSILNMLFSFLWSGILQTNYKKKIQKDKGLGNLL